MSTKSVWAVENGRWVRKALEPTPDQPKAMSAATPGKMFGKPQRNFVIDKSTSIARNERVKDLESEINPNFVPAIIAKVREMPPRKPFKEDEILRKTSGKKIYSSQEQNGSTTDILTENSSRNDIAQQNGSTNGQDDVDSLRGEYEKLTLENRFKQESLYKKIQLTNQPIVSKSAGNIPENVLETSAKLNEAEIYYINDDDRNTLHTSTDTSLLTSATSPASSLPSDVTAKKAEEPKQDYSPTSGQSHENIMVMGLGIIDVTVNKMEEPKPDNSLTSEQSDENITVMGLGIVNVTVNKTQEPKPDYSLTSEQSDENIMVMGLGGIIPEPDYPITPETTANNENTEPEPDYDHRELTGPLTERDEPEPDYADTSVSAQNVKPIPDASKVVPGIPSLSPPSKEEPVYSPMTGGMGLSLTSSEYSPKLPDSPPPPVPSSTPPTDNQDDEVVYAVIDPEMKRQARDRKENEKLAGRAEEKAAHENEEKDPYPASGDIYVQMSPGSGKIDSKRPEEVQIVDLIGTAKIDTMPSEEVQEERKAKTSMDRTPDIHKQTSIDLIGPVKIDKKQSEEVHKTKTSVDRTPETPRNSKDAAESSTPAVPVVGVLELAKSLSPHERAKAEFAERLSQSMEDEAPAGQSVPVSVTHNKDKTYRAEYTATNVGDHQIEVKFNGEDVTGSPFSAKAYDVASIRVSDIPNALVGKPVTFIVDASQAGSGNLEVAVNGGRVPAQASSEGNSRYAVTFVPKECQPHNVVLKFNGEQVPGSPFSCKVVDASKVVASGEGLKKVLVKKPATFTIDPHGGSTGGGAMPLEDCVVTITGPNKSNVPVAVKAMPDGTFTAEYTAQEVGDYQVQVSYGGVHLNNGAPYFVRAHDPNAVTVSNIATGTVGKQSTFNIDATSAGAGHLEIIVSNGGKNVPNFVHNEANTKFRVSFTPQEPHQHVISVRFNGEAVPGSPFKCDIIDGSLCVATGDGLRLTPVNKRATFVVDPKGLGRADCRVQITAPSGREVLAENIDFNADSGTYTVTYTPTESGEHQLEVAYAKVPVQGSPFTCQVHGGARPKADLPAASNDDANKPAAITKAGVDGANATKQDGVIDLIASKPNANPPATVAGKA